MSPSFAMTPAELTAFRAGKIIGRDEALREAADDLVAFCPDHGSRDTSFMDCHCPAAGEIRSKAKTEAGGSR